MSQFLTLSKSDAKFNQYLWGYWPQGQVLTAIQSFNLGSQEERVTFEVQDEINIKKPSLVKLFLLLIKYKHFLLILIPFIYVLLKNTVDGRLKDMIGLLESLLAMLLLTAGLNIRNEIHDHLSGYDRVNFDPHSVKPIVKGWVKAHIASKISWILILFSFILGCLVGLRQPEEFRVMGVVLVLILIGQLLNQNSYKYKHWAEVIFFILIGPGVASGYQVALGGGIDTEVLGFGLLWAWAVQFLVHLNNFQHLLTSSQGGIKNTMTRYGFDSSKKILKFWWFVFFILWVVYHYFYASVFWGVFTTLNLAFWSIPTLIKISQVQSPVGSDLAEIKKVGGKNFLLMCFLVVLEFVWYYYAQSRI